MTRPHGSVRSLRGGQGAQITVEMRFGNFVCRSLQVTKVKRTRLTFVGVGPACGITGPSRYRSAPMCDQVGYIEAAAVYVLWPSEGTAIERERECQPKVDPRRGLRAAGEVARSAAGMSCLPGSRERLAASVHPARSEVCQSELLLLGLAHFPLLESAELPFTPYLSLASRRV
jgi:hypothetical protein